MIINDIFINLNEFKALDNSKDATIIFTHGMAEYSKSYIEIATFFQEKGFNVITYDIRGHGKSFGKRGDVKSYNLFIDDLEEIVKYAKKNTKKVFLVGHSMGGIITNIYTSRFNNIDGVIISSSPTDYLDQVKTLRFFPYGLLAKKKMKTNFEDDKLSANNKYVKDAYDLDYVYFHLASEVLIKGMKELKKNYDNYITPVLFLYSKKDKMVNYSHGNIGLESVRSIDKELILYNNSNHNIFTDIEKHQIFKDMLTWLDKRV